ncbi:MAG: sulfotransferase domain-containing protein [Candidatus Thorarchaeota archaeon]
MPSNHTEQLPNFLCIGAERSGTTWLYEVLKNHPEVYLYPYIKEINFFSENYQKGLNWYKQFFTDSRKFSYKAIGDISPQYFHEKEAPSRVASDLLNIRLILFLRNPVNRAFSEYTYNKLILNIKDSFIDFLQKRVRAYEIGLYSQHLKRWFKVIPKEQFLILIFEEMMNDKLNSLKLISDFLEIDYSLLDKNIIMTKIHSSDIPRFHQLYTKGYKFANKINEYLVSKDLYLISSNLKRFKKLFELFSRKDRKEMIDPLLRTKLYEKYREDILELENLLGKDLDHWKLDE